MQTEFARAQMITQQMRAWDVLDERVLDAMRRTPREFFVPERYAELAFADTDIPLRAGQHMLAPKIVGRLLQALDAAPGMRALVVGCGTGFVPACLSAMGASVRAIEIHAELAAAAARNLKRAGFGQVEVVTGDTFNLDMGKDYALIAVCGALPLYDERFARALAVGGRLFVVVGGEPAAGSPAGDPHRRPAWTARACSKPPSTRWITRRGPSPSSSESRMHDPRDLGRGTQGAPRSGRESAGPGRARRLGTATCAHSGRRTCAHEPGSGTARGVSRETRKPSSCATREADPCGWRIFWRTRDLRNVANLSGGISAWSEAVDATVPQY